jgi:lipopolysaccharide biosynthesis regulator YciM
MLATNTSMFKMPKLKTNEADDRQFNAASHRAMELAQSHLEANPNDARASYALGVVARKAYLHALHDTNSVGKYHERGTRLDPEMVDAHEGEMNRIDAAFALAAIYRRKHRVADRVAALEAVDQVEHLHRAHSLGYQRVNTALLRQVREHILITVASSGPPIRG